MNLPTRLLTVLCMTALISAASAQENGLYGANAPQDTAFIRIVNNTGQSVPNIPVGNLSFSDINTGEVTAYRPLSPGVYMIRSSGGQADLTAGEKKYYTVVISSSDLKIFTDTRHSDPLRSQLVLYNISRNESVSLRTADGQTEVIESVGPQSSADVTVNPVRTKLAVFSDSNRKKIEDLGGVDMSEGQSYSVFVMNTNSSAAAVLEQAQVLAK